MKSLVIIIAFLLTSLFCLSQPAITPKKALSRKEYHKDSIPLMPKHQLDSAQTLGIYSINILLGREERELQQKYQNSDSLKVQLESLEEKRDTRYKNLIPSDKYQLFKQKKLLLVGKDGTIIR